MPKNVIVINVFLSAPGNMGRYVDRISGIIYDFNELRGFNRGTIFRPIHWKKDVIGQVTTDPQLSINSDLLSSCDLLIGVIGDRLGTETPRSPSGTAEEILNFVGKKDPLFKGKHVQVIFRLKIDSNINEIDHNQIEGVKSFKKKVQKDVITAEFSEDYDLDGIVGRFLESACTLIESSYYHLQKQEKEYMSEPHNSLADKTTEVEGGDRQRTIHSESSDEFGILDEVEKSSEALHGVAQCLNQYNVCVSDVTSALSAAHEEYGNTPENQKKKFDQIGSSMFDSAERMRPII